MEEELLNKILQWGLGLSLLTPFIVTSQTSFPYIFGKAIFFQLLVVGLLVAFLFKKKLELELDALSVGLLIYLGILVLSSVFGVDLGRSVWSTQERMTGVFFHLHLVAFYFLLKVLLRDRSDWLSFFKGVVLSSIVLQVVTLVRGNTLGNEGLLANYLLLSFFISLLVMKEGWLWKVLSGVNCLGIGWFIFNMERRSSLVSIVIGLGVWAVLRIYRKREWWLVILFILPLLLGLSNIEFLRGIETRVVSWGISIEAWLARPLLGWGLENYIYGWARYFDPAYGASNWFDKAHNQYLETLVTTGVLGLVSYLGVLGIALFKAFKEESMVALLVAFMVNSLFWFYSPATLILFFIVLGYISWLE